MPDLLLFTALVLAWWLIRRSPRKAAGWVNLAQYYKTAHWIETRNRKRREGKYRCEKCHNKKNLEVHHKHYKSLYHERMDDLQLLCSKCHTRGSGRK